MGYEISYAYTNFDNATMYPLILLILAAVDRRQQLLSHWERMLLARRGQALMQTKVRRFAIRSS